MVLEMRVRKKGCMWNGYKEGIKYFFSSLLRDINGMREKKMG